MASSLFAIQVFLPLPAGSSLRANLDQIVRQAPEYAGFEEKRLLYQRIASLIVPAVGWVELGNWDFTNDSSEAEGEYEQWCNGTLEDAQEREQRAAQALAIPFRSAAPTTYMFLTQLFLLQQGTTGEAYVAQSCNVPQEHLWTKQTFHRLLSIIPYINFLAVLSDAVYLCPGSDAQGITVEELQGERYKYLHRIV
jgi:hypothetical protein